jgi:hypothetical protein
MVAFAAFLLNERDRHQEDIVMIDAKLKILRDLGIEAQDTAPWIKTEDLYEACEKPFDAQSYLRKVKEDHDSGEYP